MGVKAPRTVPATPSGRYTVNYRHIDGTTMDAIVTGAGTGSTLNLKVPSLPKSAQYKTNVPKMTGLRQTNVWSYRA